mgnify:CR=1 FL=1
MLSSGDAAAYDSLVAPGAKTSPEFGDEWLQAGVTRAVVQERLRSEQIINKFYELSKEIGIDREEVIRICIEEHVPIYHGKIDKTLFQAQLQALGAMPQAH